MTKEFKAAHGKANQPLIIQKLNAIYERDFTINLEAAKPNLKLLPNDQVKNVCNEYIKKVQEQAALVEHALQSSLANALNDAAASDALKIISGCIADYKSPEAQSTNLLARLERKRDELVAKPNQKTLYRAMSAEMISPLKSLATKWWKQIELAFAIIDSDWKKYIKHKQPNRGMLDKKEVLDLEMKFFAQHITYDIDAAIKLIEHQLTLQPEMQNESNWSETVNVVYAKLKLNFEDIFKWFPKGELIHRNLVQMRTMLNDCTSG